MLIDEQLTRGGVEPESGSLGSGERDGRRPGGNSRALDEGASSQSEHYEYRVRIGVGVRSVGDGPGLPTPAPAPAGCGSDRDRSSLRKWRGRSQSPRDNHSNSQQLAIESNPLSGLQPFLPSTLSLSLPRPSEPMARRRLSAPPELLSVRKPCTHILLLALRGFSPAQAPVQVTKPDT